jgi:hypothetical protein
MKFKEKQGVLTGTASAERSFDTKMRKMRED